MFSVNELWQKQNIETSTRKTISKIIRIYGYWPVSQQHVILCAANEKKRI